MAGAASGQRTAGPDLRPFEPTSWHEVDVGVDQSVPGRSAAERPLPPAGDASAGRPANPATAQLEVHLARAASGRIDRLVVQLEPANLGKVEIRLDFGDRDRIGAAVIADRPETLDALQRDAAALERSLRDAGFRTDGGNLSFSLRRDHQEREGQGHPAAGAAGDGVSHSAAALNADAAGLQPLVRGLHLLDIEA